MNSPRVQFIFKNLSIKEREEFLKEILEANLSGKGVKGLIDSWEATAEINACSHSRDNILCRSKKLKQFLLHSKHV
jgi:hypothetical protein